MVAAETKGKTEVMGLFLDFDGTISPLTVPRHRAKPSRHVQQILEKIAKKIPVAVLTTKDLRFIRKRLSFAWAWAAIGGIEIQIGDRTLTSYEADSSSVNTRLRAIENAAKSLGLGVRLERKELTDGRIGGLCIDWRFALEINAVTKEVDALLADAERYGLIVKRYAGHPYADIFASDIDKGRALLSIRNELKIEGPIMYLGDSELDNPAFHQADISIGVANLETPQGLDSAFLIEFENIGDFFEELWVNHLVFDPKSRWLVSRALPNRS